MSLSCLHTNSFDEAIALPTEFSAKIARNTQLILQNETGVTDVVDPLAGSYYVENLTNELIQNANKIIVLDKGEIIEQGNHDELIKNDSYYKKLIALQSFK